MSEQTFNIQETDTDFHIWQDGTQYVGCWSGTVNGIYSESEDMELWSKDFESAKQELIDNWKEYNQPEPTITPHKGGRTETVSLRFTPDELRLLDIVRGQDSRSDWIAEQVADAGENMRSHLARVYEICSDADYAISELEAGQVQIAHLEDDTLNYSLIYDGSEWQVKLTDSANAEDYRWRGDDFEQATLQFIGALQRRV